MKKRHLRFCLLAAAIPVQAIAGGLYMYEIGTTDIGLAGAGMAARAEDASTIYGNPAGMTRLAGNQMSVGAQALYGDIEYKVNSQSRAQQTVGGGSPGNVVGWLPGGSAFYSHSLSNDLKVGIGLYGNYGLALDYGSSWAGRNLADQATLMAMTIQPTVAYRLNDKWSVGAGLTANYGIAKLERVQFGTGAKLDQDDSDWQYGGRIGVMFEPSKAMRLGVVWTSKVEYDFSFKRTFTYSGPFGGVWTRTFNADAAVNAPQQVMASVYQKLSDRWALTGNLGWQDWSQFSSNSVETNNGTTTSKLKLQDTWHMALGAQYQYNATTKINGGVAYDSSWYKSDNNGSFTMPSSSAWRFGLGVQYTLSPKSELGLAAEYLRGGEMRDPSPLIGGKFDNPYMVFLSAQY
ncbi:MAG TPA: outer membrane protein transport protein, partial [Azospira sp.]|nr:outer membrane protein transport protein [Azospira sp.]